MTKHNTINRFEDYVSLRNTSLSGLEKCNFVLSPAELEEKGFATVNSQYFSKQNEEHEFHEFMKGNHRVVYIETYVEREGGLYFQSLYASADCIDQLNAKR